MESLRVPDLGPPVPTAGQITGLDVDLRYLVCLFVYQPLCCQVSERDIGETWLCASLVVAWPKGADGRI